MFEQADVALHRAAVPDDLRRCWLRSDWCVPRGRRHECAVRPDRRRFAGAAAADLAADAPQDAACRSSPSQLPEALELIARALRAGHSLAAGFNLVASEMSAPIAIEFGRVFEEQNLGIPMEEALDSLTERVPNLDLKFFVDRRHPAAADRW